MRSRDHKRQLVIRLRWIGILLIVFGCGFGGYVVFSEELPSPPSIDIESAGFEIPELEEGSSTTRQIFFIGSSLFLLIGFTSTLFAKRLLKKIENLNTKSEK